MTETQKQIQELKKALPRVKEKVAAVALSLVMSLAMMASVSYAWYTLSFAPEVTGVNTTVAANGNLEIALAGLYEQNEEGKPILQEPADSGVGDSSAAEGQTIVASNMTWGNLVNLSDESYGISDIELRPALLSSYNLTRYPLYGATYGGDGRVESTAERYSYATYRILDDGTAFFDAENVFYGVRAISSVKYENIVGASQYTQTYEEMTAKIRGTYASAKAIYADMIDGTTKLRSSGKTCISALESVITVYVQTKADSVLGGSNGEDNYGPYIRDLYEILEIFSDVLEKEGEALLYMANLQVYLKNETAGTETFKTLDELLNATSEDLTAKDVELKSLETYKKDLTNLKKCLTYFGGLYNSCNPDDPNCATVTWNQIRNYVNDIVNITSSELNGMPIGSLSSDDIGGLLGAVGGNSSSNKVVIKEGILKNTEQRLGECLADHGITVAIPVKATIGVTMTVTVKATVVTDAAVPFTSAKDQQITESKNTGSNAEGEAVAKDTYGMALDFWVRTNAADTVLTLEGSTIYEEIAATGVDKNGNTTDLYTLTVEGIDYDVYSLTENDTTTWYYLSNHATVDASLLEDNDPTKKTVKVVSGYQGENRVWEDWESMLEAGLILEDNTTQGAGSCYVFYADPSEQASILELLSAFHIAFLDQDGIHLATAKLNTENAYAINGKVTVPLEITTGVEYTTEDSSGAEVSGKGITKLNQNEATLITAIVYLNGNNLENEHVLSASEIQGNLNLQFGSSVSLTAKPDEDLQSEYRTIRATAASGNQNSTREDSPITFDYDGDAKEVTVTLTVEGTQPEKVSGFFVRAINATQGTKGETESFTKQENGTWTATFSLTTPGDYVFRSVFVDGAEYTLEECPSVKISGLKIESVICDKTSGIHMTADTSFPVTVTASINAAEELMPKQVRAQFRSSDNTEEFNAIMSYDSVNKQWTGTANITSSGTYTLEYLVMDGEYYELSEDQQTTLILYLGMTTAVYTNDTDYTDGGKFEGENKTIHVAVKIWDDTGTGLEELTGVNLYYHMSGSSLDQYGMHAELTWISSTGYYEGNLSMSQAGIYSFNRLTVETGSGTNTIWSAKSAPTYTALSPNPPTYKDNSSDEYQFKTDGSAALKVKISDSATARTYARVTNSKDGIAYLVEGILGTPEIVNGVQINEWAFTLPADENNAQDGEWTLTDLYFQNVYVDNKNYPITEVDPTLDTADTTCYHVAVPEGEVTTYVVSTVNVAVTKNGEPYTGEDFGVDVNGNVTGTFMQEHTVNGVTITITDWNGDAITGVSDVIWSITNDASTSHDYGGYTGATRQTHDLSVQDRELTKSEDGKTVTPATGKAPILQVAGEYTSTITVKVGKSETKINGPSFKVYSVKPYAKIAAVSPTNAINTKITWTTDWKGTPTFTASESKTNIFSDYAATLYASATVDNASMGVTNAHGYMAEPKLTITVYGAADGYTATLKLPAGSASEVTFERTGNGSITKEIGEVSTIKYFGIGNRHYLEGYTGHGNVSITTMTLTKGDASYTVTLDNPLVITNPSSVDQTS